MSAEGRRRGPAGGPGRGPLGGAAVPVEKAKDFKGSFGALLSYLAPFRWQIVIVLILAVAASLFSIVGPKILALAVDELAAGIGRMMMGSPIEINLGYIGAILLLLTGLYLISSLFSAIQGRVMAGIATKVSYRLRNSLMEKINRMPLQYFQKNSQGDVLSRITNDVDTVEQSLSQSLTQILSSVAILIGVVIMMLTISWQLTLVAVCIVPAALLLVTGLVRLSQKHFYNQQEYLGRVNGQVEETYGGHIILKAFNGEKKARERFERENETLAKSAKKAEFLSGLMMPMVSFVGHLGYVVVCIVGASMAASGGVSIGGIQAFIQYIRNFTQPIVQLANLSNQLQRMVAASERIFSFLSEEEETDLQVKIPIDHVNMEGDIRFDHVKFGYDSDRLILKDFSAQIKSGQKIAVVGPTGAGKTTMVKLLMRFYDISEGVISVDGHDIAGLNRRAFRNKLGMVLQDTWLFNGTILENIRYGKLDATNAQVMEAAKKAQADHFIRTLPGSYRMELNEETTNVSQGQKQLLTIARAILADPKILILDEATSSVDTRTEILVQKAMDHLMAGRTSFIIAHRLSTIRNADLILCMNEGDIVEQGTHEELLEKQGFYANLYHSQFERIS